MFAWHLFTTEGTQGTESFNPVHGSGQALDRKLNKNFSGALLVFSSMFCPRCGKAEQLPESYCRQCGLFLPDLSKAKRESPPEEHLKANTVLSMMTIVASFTLAILLYAVLGFRSNTHPLIYVTAGLLLGMGGWHIQTFIRMQLLKKQWERRTPLAENKAAKAEQQGAVEGAATGKLLDEANFADAVPASVTENTTRQLAETQKRAEW